MPNKSDKEFEAKFEQWKASKAKVLACNSFMSESLSPVGDDANHEKVLNYVNLVFQRSKITGLKGIVFFSSGSRKLKNGFKRVVAEKQFVELLKKIAPLSQAQGIEIWLEPLHRKKDNFINTQTEGAAL